MKFNFSSVFSEVIEHGGCYRDNGETFVEKQNFELVTAIGQETKPDIECARLCKPNFDYASVEFAEVKTIGRIQEIFVSISRNLGTNILENVTFIRYLRIIYNRFIVFIRTYNSKIKQIVTC